MYPIPPLGLDWPWTFCVRKYASASSLACDHVVFSHFLRVVVMHHQCAVLHLKMQGRGFSLRLYHDATFLVAFPALRVPTTSALFHATIT
jgi:hypothetical protein